MGAPRDFKTEGRANKARALALVLAADPDLVADPCAVLHLDDAGWARAAAVANVNVPSDTTRRMVPTYLRAIAEDRARNPDPFAAFPQGAA